MIGVVPRDKRLVLQSLTQTVTDEGEITETAATVATVWAAIQPLSARELWFAQQSQATTTHKITILKRDGITSRMQGTWNSRTFKFESVINTNEANEELVILATEVTA